MKKCIASLLLAVLLCACLPALAAKSWVEMGREDAKADTIGLKGAQVSTDAMLESYAAGDQFVFRVEDDNVSYSIQFLTRSTPGWYTLQVNNNGVVMEGWNVSGGLNMYLCQEDGTWLIDGKQLPKGTQASSLRLEPDDLHTLSFVAFNNSNGTVTFEIAPVEDLPGEDLFGAVETPAGVIAQQTIAVPQDQDWFFIPAREEGWQLSLSVENRIDENLLVELYDEFDEKLMTRSCAYADAAQLQYACEPGMSYFVRIASEKQRRDGRYFFGWCDGEHHALSAMQTVEEATCTGEGLQARVCSLCGVRMFEQTLPMIAHEPGEMTIAAHASCTADGLQEQKCLSCATVLAAETISATGHLAGESVITAQPTCTAEGLQEQKCQLCHAVLHSETLSAKGHAAAESMVETLPTCTEKGVSRVRCSVCMSILQEVELAAAGHQYGQWQETVAPTRDSAGTEEMRCAACGDVQTRSLPKLTLLESLFGR